MMTEPRQPRARRIGELAVYALAVVVSGASIGALVALAVWWLP